MSSQLETNSYIPTQSTYPLLFLTKLTFWLAAPLYLLSGIFFILKIGEFDFYFDGVSTHNYIEGIIAGFAAVLFIPMFLVTANYISKSQKILGGLIAIIGLFGSIGAYGATAYFRTLTYDLIQHGVPVELLESYYAGYGGLMTIFFFLAPLFPLAGILTGIALIRLTSLPKWVGITILLGSILFPLAQVVGIFIVYPVGLLLWTIAFPYLGRIITN
ncbi:hypothetical protein [Aquibacillus albus]|uniref:DUF4386 family protein n=1 Tax=Aquibacillus albus TaxID=1168171 RepID=A0ABS2N6C0_9BACI|nr:hypothetical protein [Aquibacillus albus]MBM7573435.1 hypothetical protein [Aquibacillus albus]